MASISSSMTKDRKADRYAARFMQSLPCVLLVAEGDKGQYPSGGAGQTPWRDSKTTVEAGDLERSHPEITWFGPRRHTSHAPLTFQPWRCGRGRWLTPC